MTTSHACVGEDSEVFGGKSQKVISTSLLLEGMTKIYL